MRTSGRKTGGEVGKGMGKRAREGMRKMIFCRGSRSGWGGGGDRAEGGSCLGWQGAGVGGF